MSSLAEVSRSGVADLAAHKLRLIWKHPEGRYHDVGRFEELRDGRFAFRYTQEVGSVPGFSPLLQFPDLDRVYVSEALPAFLANRVMSRQRPSYGEHLERLGLSLDATPFEILARTGGPRATDTFHVVDVFDPAARRHEGAFFVSGVRYKDFDLSSLQAGQQLKLIDEPDNEINPRAVLLAADGSELGWVPDWLVDDLHSFQMVGGVVSVAVEQVNEDAPPHLSVLCRLVMERLEYDA